LFRIFDFDEYQFVPPRDDVLYISAAIVRQFPLPDFAITQMQPVL
jgi:hypothetical protein